MDSTWKFLRDLILWSPKIFWKNSGPSKIDLMKKKFLSHHTLSVSPVTQDSKKLGSRTDMIWDRKNQKYILVPRDPYPSPIPPWCRAVKPMMAHRYPRTWLSPTRGPAVPGSALPVCRTSKTNGGPSVPGSFSPVTHPSFSLFRASDHFLRFSPQRSNFFLFLLIVGGSKVENLEHFFAAFFHILYITFERDGQL